VYNSGRAEVDLNDNGLGTAAFLEPVFLEDKIGK
jgi:hypothetical protein